MKIDEKKNVSLDIIDIVSASYGPTDITDRINSMYKAGTRKFLPKSETWGDTDEGVTKTLKIVYKLKDKTTTAEAKEDTDEKKGEFVLLPSGIHKDDEQSGEAVLHEKIGGKQFYKDWKKRREQQIEKIKGLY